MTILSGRLPVPVTWPDKDRGPESEMWQAGAVRVLFSAAWVFIFLAALYDGYYAWQFRSTFLAWELNPVARWAAVRLGLTAVLWFKALSLAFTYVLARHCLSHRPRLALELASLGVVAYLVVTAHYAAIYLSA